MQITFNWIVAILVVIISQSAFAAGILFFTPHNKKPGRILALLIVVIALWLFDDFMRLSLIYRQHPNLYFLPIFYSFSFGPLIWFYVKSLVNHQFKFGFKDVWHFVPVMLQACLYIFLTFCSYPIKNWYWENIHRQYTYRIEFDGTLISLSIYLILSFRLVKHYQLWLNNNFSEVSKIRLNWLKIILAILLLLCFQWFTEVILRDVYNLYFNYDYTIEILGMIVLVLGIAGLRQSNLGAVNYLEESTETDQPAKVAFEPDPAILKKISNTMQEQKLYLNPTLTLLEMADDLGLNSKTVSRHINIGFQKSFNDYINSFRVEEVKRRLKSGELERLTIMGIAMDSGFNSKTTFNRIFREFTGLSPSDFIK
ncbi:MAG: helix-turn-helix transcriptional regulator [Mucilaginibacter sp.]|nr:helix-turn-helix transcriptional regulator [Mucilaginibacter sp.]